MGHVPLTYVNCLKKKSFKIDWPTEIKLGQSGVEFEFLPVDTH